MEFAAGLKRDDACGSCQHQSNHIMMTNNRNDEQLQRLLLMLLRIESVSVRVSVMECTFVCLFGDSYRLIGL
jgi:hypothetical protein